MFSQRLSAHDQLRYSRQIMLPEFGEQAQEKLKSARVLIIGAGGLGSPALQYLAAAGVGNLGIMDADVVDMSNLQRQVLFTEDQVGKPKVVCARERLLAMNPDIQVQAIPERLTRENALDFVSSYDLVVDGSDNFATRYLVNDACIMTGKPFVYGAIHQYEGQVSLFNFKGGPSYRCIFPVPDDEPLPSCDEIGVLGVLPGIIGTYQASEAIKALTGVGETLSGKLLVLNLFTMKSHLLGFEPNPENMTMAEFPDDNLYCSASSGGVDEISAQELFEKLACKNPVLQVLDAREQIQDNALQQTGLQSILFSEWEHYDVELDTSKEILVFCERGVKSKIAAEKLKKCRPEMLVYHLAGGLLAYEAYLRSRNQSAE